MQDDGKGGFPITFRMAMPSFRADYTGEKKHTFGFIYFLPHCCFGSVYCELKPDETELEKTTVTRRHFSEHQ